MLDGIPRSGWYDLRRPTARDSESSMPRRILSRALTPRCEALSEMQTVQEVESKSSRGGHGLTVDPAPSTEISPSFARCAISPHRSDGSLIVSGKSDSIRVQIASERSELEQAFELLATHYRARGYDSPGEMPYRFTPYHVLPETITLVAKREGQVCATMSLVPDTSLLGLPMESIYGPEVAELRRQGRRLAEATSLADSNLTCSEFIQVFTTFIKIAMHYHVRQGGDTWVITINPRHRNFYQKVLGFTPLGPQRSYPSVQGHPAKAYLLDVERMSQRPEDAPDDLRRVAPRPGSLPPAMVRRNCPLLRPEFDPDRSPHGRRPAQERRVPGQPTALA